MAGCMSLLCGWGCGRVSFDYVSRDSGGREQSLPDVPPTDVPFRDTSTMDATTDPSIDVPGMDRPADMPVMDTSSDTTMDAFADTTMDAPLDTASDTPSDVIAPPDAPSSLGLIAWYRMEDTPIDGLDDSSGHNHTGACVTPDCPTSVVARVGTGLRSFSTTRYIRVPFAAELNTPSGFTVAVWVFIDSLPATEYTCAVSKPFGVMAEDSWSLCFDPTGRPLFYTASAEDTGDYLFAPAISTGAWHHIAVTWDATTKRLVVDGVQQVQRDQLTVFDAHDILIGADENVGLPIYPFSGRLDELRIYDRALALADIAELLR